METVQESPAVLTTWTRETIYNPETLAYYRMASGTYTDGITMPPYVRESDFRSWERGNRFVFDRFTDPFRAALLAETRWVSPERPRFPPSAHALSVGRGDAKCHICDGEESVQIEIKGLDTGITRSGFYECPCAIYRTYCRAWSKFREETPRFKDVRLPKFLQPDTQLSSLSTKRQREIIETIKAAPGDSYLFQGQPGTGKTHFAVSLYKNALLNFAVEKHAYGTERTKVVRIGASALLKELSDWESRNKLNEYDPTPPPTLSEKMVRLMKQRGVVVHLFIDEIDKIRNTDFKMGALFDLVNAIYETGGQIVATCNMTIADMMAKWGDSEAVTIIRRISDGPGAHLEEFVDA